MLFINEETACRMLPKLLFRTTSSSCAGSFILYYNGEMYLCGVP